MPSLTSCVTLNRNSNSKLLMRQKPRAQGPWVSAGCDVRAHRNSSRAVQQTLWSFTLLPVEDWGIYSSTADSVGHWQLIAESLPWDLPSLKQSCFPKSCPFFMRRVGEPISDNNWKRGSEAWTPFLNSREFWRAIPGSELPPRNTEVPFVSASQFNLSLFLILFPSLPFRFVPKITLQSIS